MAEPNPGKVVPPEGMADSLGQAPQVAAFLSFFLGFGPHGPPPRFNRARGLELQSAGHAARMAAPGRQRMLGGLRSAHRRSPRHADHPARGE